MEKIKGKRNVKRVDPSTIDENFILDFKFTVCQKECIKLIYEMRVVSTSQIAIILKKTESYVRSQLKNLYKNGFVYRIFEGEKKIGSGSNEAYWMLDRGGAFFIAGAYGVKVKELNWNIRDNLIEFEKLTHSIKITNSRCVLELAAQKNNHSIEECYCDRHLYYQFNADGKKMGISPDMFLTYNDGKKLYQFFFEIDTGTMSITGPKSRSSVVISKIPRYEKFLASNEWKPYFEVYPRIVFLTKTRQRAKYMAQAIRNSRESNLEFLITTFEIFNKNPLENIFIKASDESVTNLFK